MLSREGMTKGNCQVAISGASTDAGTEEVSTLSTQRAAIYDKLRILSTVNTHSSYNSTLKWSSYHLNFCLIWRVCMCVSITNNQTSIEDIIEHLKISF